MNNGQIDAFLRTFPKEVEEGNAAIFAGAGLSRPAGFVDWKMLLKSVADELGLDIDKENNLVALAQYYCNERFGPLQHQSSSALEEFTRVSAQLGGSCIVVTR